MEEALIKKHTVPGYSSVERVVNKKSKLIGHQREHQSQSMFLLFGIFIKLSRP
jgi:hypothetical protein